MKNVNAHASYLRRHLFILAVLCKLALGPRVQRVGPYKTSPNRNELKVFHHYRTNNQHDTMSKRSHDAVDSNSQDGNTAKRANQDVPHDENAVVIACAHENAEWTSLCIGCQADICPACEAECANDECEMRWCQRCLPERSSDNGICDHCNDRTSECGTPRPEDCDLCPQVTTSLVCCHECSAGTCPGCRVECANPECDMQYCHNCFQDKTYACQELPEEAVSEDMCPLCCVEAAVGLGFEP